MKKNKNMNTNVNDMFEVLATLIPDLVDTIMDDTNEDINKEKKNRKCNYKCHCSCCDDDISLQDLLGDLPSLDELLDDNNNEDIVAKISPETNQRIKENETKIKNKTKKFLVDSPVKVTQQENRNLSENKILITANDLRNKQEKSARLFKIKNAVISIVNDETFGENKDIYIASKGQGDKGLFFKNNLSNANSYYVRAFKLNDIENKVVNSELYKNSDMLTLFGETYGMQDLKYGLENGHIGYRLFDVYVGKPRYGRFLNYEECKAFASELGIERVPSLYVGEYSYKKVKELTDGKTTLGKNKNQIREGVVIRPLNERYISELGRVFLKSVSEAYKLRKGETTEYN